MAITISLQLPCALACKFSHGKKIANYERKAAVGSVWVCILKKPRIFLDRFELIFGSSNKL